MSTRKLLVRTSIAVAFAAMSGAVVAQPDLVQEGDSLYLVETLPSGETVKKPAGAVWDGFVASTPRAAPELNTGTVVVEGGYLYLVEKTQGHSFQRRIAAVWDGNMAGAERAAPVEHARVHTGDEG